MDRRDFLRSAAVVAGGLVLQAKAPEQSLVNLEEQLEAIRKEYDLPGIAAAAVRGKRVVAEGVAGVRRVGAADKITPDDRFALASCTKPMTATMVMRVIDSGRLSFETTLAE